MLISVIFLAFSLFRPSYVEQSYVTSSYASEGLYSYTCSVNGSNPLYPAGTVLPPGQAAYFMSVSPILNMDFAFGINASDSVDVSSSRKIIVVATGKGKVEDKDQIFWQKEFPVISTDDVQLTNGAVTSNHFSLNISEIQNIVKDIQDKLDYSKDANLTVITYVNLHGSINGNNVNEVLKYSVPITLSQSYYQVSKDLESNNTVDTKGVRIVRASPSIIMILASLILFVAATVSLVAVRKLKSKGLVDPSEIYRLEQKSILAKFDDWVSEGKMPAENNGLIEVKLNSLRGLVDAASDMDARVIHDREKGIYFAIHDGAMYTFDESNVDALL